MLRSRLFFLPRKNAPADAVTASHQLLTRASFFRQGQGAGLWETLPLGKRVLDKLQAIIVSEMDAIEGCQQVEMPSLMTSETWRKTKRWDAIGQEMFRLRDRKDTEMMLAPTHEEAFTELVAGMHGIVSRAHLPIYLYQIGRKFRDELRPRAGLLRAREFIMKDLYTFDESENKALETYEKVCRAYERIFNERLGCKVLKAAADSGNMGGTYSHEFHFESPVGEDVVIKCDTGSFCANTEVTKLKGGDSCTDLSCSCKGSGKLVETKCIEVGHAFYLGTKYSAPLAARFVPEGDTKPSPLQMGSYGLGVTRIIASIVETSHDSSGIIWPKAIAPFQIVLVGAPGADARLVSETFAALKTKFGSELLFDDRGENVGMSSKLIDAKLIGAPFIVVVRKTGEFEIIERSTQQTSTVKDLSHLGSKLT